MVRYNTHEGVVRYNMQMFPNPLARDDRARGARAHSPRRTHRDAPRRLWQQRHEHEQTSQLPGELYAYL